MRLSFATPGTQGEWYSFGISFFPHEGGELFSFGNDFAGPRAHTHGMPNFDIMLWVFILPPWEGLFVVNFIPLPRAFEWFLFVTKNDFTGVSRGSTHGEANDKWKLFLTTDGGHEFHEI